MTKRVLDESVVMMADAILGSIKQCNFTNDEIMQVRSAFAKAPRFIEANQPADGADGKTDAPQDNKPPAPMPNRAQRRAEAKKKK